jgi:hypothetical protein
MTYKGTVRGGVIIPEKDARLAEGQVVELTVPDGPTWAEVLKDFIGQAQGLPADAARNHDHYLYGTPRK